MSDLIRLYKHHRYRYNKSVKQLGQIKRTISSKGKKKKRKNNDNLMKKARIIIIINDFTPGGSRIYRLLSSGWSVLPVPPLGRQACRRAAVSTRHGESA